MASMSSKDEQSVAEHPDAATVNSVSTGPMPSVSGFLLKKSTSGEWQRRYFESNGTFLTYYKSQKMTKLLAALSLPQVGGITLVGPVDDARGPGAVFQLDLKDRTYVLRTTTLAEAENWVSVLIQLRDSAVKTKPAGLDGPGGVAGGAGAGGSVPYAPPGPRDAPPPGLRESGGAGEFVKEPRSGLSFKGCCVVN